MTLAINIIDGCDLSNEVCHEETKEEQGNAVRINNSFHSKRHLTSCTLLTRQSTSVLNVGVPSDSEAFK